MNQIQKTGNHSQLYNAAAAFLLFTLILSSPALAKMGFDFDPNLDFSKFKTFAYIGGANMLEFRQLNPNYITDRVHSGVSQALIQRGLKEVSPKSNQTWWFGIGPIANPRLSRRRPELGDSSDNMSATTGRIPTI